MIVNTELAKSKGHANSDLWETPDYIFKPLNDEFNFTLDPCCTEQNHKCPNFFTDKENGLLQPWNQQTVFVNPPYSRGNIDKWVEKCWRVFTYGYFPGPIVALLPVSTSANWFHEYIIDRASIRFYERRIRFVGAPYTAPFSSMLVIWDRNKVKVTSIKQFKS